LIVVSNTSPIINLAAVGHLNLLQQLYNEITIPEAVYREIVIVGAGQAGSHEVQTASWINTRTVSNQTGITLMEIELDRGEAEAIALAAELSADLLLLDERRARRIASRLGLRYIGVLGVLLDAKNRGDLTAVKPVLEALITQAGFWVSTDLYARVIEASGE
jgi:predicted nucleic acid-binding protein